MAIIKNMWLNGAKKRLAGAVLYSTSGRTIARALASNVKNPRTPPQMAQRVKWANLVNLYRANQSWMTKAFETKKENQSDYNKFMSLNVASSHVYLTKQEASIGTCVVGPYRITDGTLESIAQSESSGFLQTNILLEGISGSVRDMTIRDFTDIVTKNNNWIQVGDQISFILNEQIMDSVSSTLRCNVVKEELILDDISTEKVGSKMPYAKLATVEISGKTYLAADLSSKIGAAAFVLSRQQSGRTLVSSQYLTMFGNEDIYATYTSKAQMRAAMKSYDVTGIVFLDSTDQETKQNPLYGLEIDNITLNGKAVYPGAEAKTVAELNAASVTVVLSGAPSGAVTKVSYSIKNGSRFFIENFSVVDDIIILDDNQFTGGSPEDKVTVIYVSAENYTVSTNFAG